MQIGTLFQRSENVPFPDHIPLKLHNACFIFSPELELFRSVIMWNNGSDALSQNKYFFVQKRGSKIQYRIE